MKNKNHFNLGDVIRNKHPYEGESAYMIIAINKNEYRCAALKGKYCSKNVFDTRIMILDFESAYNSYEKIE